MYLTFRTHPCSHYCNVGFKLGDDGMEHKLHVPIGVVRKEGKTVDDLKAMIAAYDGNIDQSWGSLAREFGVCLKLLLAFLLRPFHLHFFTCSIW